MKEWLNKAGIALNHGDRAAKWEFFYWTLWQKVIVIVFMFTYAMIHNWPLHYLRTLIGEKIL